MVNVTLNPTLITEICEIIKNSLDEEKLNKFLKSNPNASGAGEQSGEILEQSGVNEKILNHLKEFYKKQGKSPEQAQIDFTQKITVKLKNSTKKETTRLEGVTSLCQQKLKQQKLKEQQKAEKENAQKKKLNEMEKDTKKQQETATFSVDDLDPRTRRNILRFIQEPDNDFNPYNKMADAMLKLEISKTFIKKEISLTSNELNNLSSSVMGSLKDEKRHMNETFMMEFNQKNIMPELRAEFEKNKASLLKLQKPRQRSQLQLMVRKVLLRSDNGFKLEDINNFRPTSSNLPANSELSGTIHNNRNLNIVDFFAEYFFYELNEYKIDMENDEFISEFHKSSASGLGDLFDSGFGNTMLILDTMMTFISLSTMYQQKGNTSVVTSSVSFTEEQINKFLNQHESLIQKLRNLPEGQHLTEAQKKFLEEFKKLKEYSTSLANQRVAAENGDQAMRPSDSTDN